MSDADAYLEAALELIQDTSEIALRHFRTSMSVDDKSNGDHFDPVTQADVEIEEQLRAELCARYPDHGIIGEEQADRRANSEFEWIIDPIDGTRAFMSGMPIWGTLLGLMRDKRAILGLMNQPYLRETFFGNTVEAWLLRESELTKLETRRRSTIEEAVLYATHPDLFITETDREAFATVASRARLQRYGGDCYSYCLLAMGHVDLVIEAGLHPYDIVPLIPIVEGAGGIVTDWQGNDAHGGGRIVAAGNQPIHAAALTLLNSV